MALNDKTTQELEDLYKTTLSDKQQSYKKARPSASSALCQRNMALDMLLEPSWNTIPQSLPYYAAIGSAIEKKVLNGYEKKGLLYLSQWKMADELMSELPDFNVGGIIDAFIEHNGRLLLYDIKSVGSVETSEEKDVAGIVKPVHLAQMQTYAAITGFTEVYLQYFSRKVQDTFSLTDSSPTTRIVKIQTDAKSLERQVGIILFAIRSKELGVVPDKLTGIKKSHCSSAFCPYVEFCWNDERLKQNVTMMQDFLTPESISELKIECLNDAAKYIANMPIRYQKTLDLLKVARDKRLKDNKGKIVQGADND